MTTREAIIKNYRVFIPVLRSLPLTHRYWHFFLSENLDVDALTALNAEIKIGKTIEQAQANAILNELQSKLTETTRITDQEYDGLVCSEKLTIFFHDPAYPIITTDNDPNFPNTKKREQCVENNKDGRLTSDRITESELNDPLLLEKHICYGGFTLKIKYTNAEKIDTKVVFEEGI